MKKIRDLNFNKWDEVYAMEDKNFNEDNNEYNDDNESGIDVKWLIFIALIIAVIVILFIGIR